jgi:TonB family protein
MGSVGPGYARSLVNRPRSFLAAVALLASLVATAASAKLAYKPKTPERAPVPCEPLAGAAPDAVPTPRDRVGLNFPADVLTSADTAVVEVCTLVDSLGIVRQARIERGGTPYDSSAVDAVRWWEFAPARRNGRRVAARVSVTVTVRPPVDADPLTPDVLGMALKAEAAGQDHDALDAWTGVLARAGIHPTLGNEWVIREHILRLAADLGTASVIPQETAINARGARERMLRDMSRATNADLAKQLDQVLLEAPWYADAYRWRASARAASGQRVGAIRDVLCYQIATRDSAKLAMADRALVALATGDTLSAMEMLEHE